MPSSTKGIDQFRGSSSSPRVLSLASTCSPSAEGRAPETEPTRVTWIASAESFDRFGVDTWAGEAPGESALTIEGYAVDGATVARLIVEPGAAGLRVRAEGPSAGDGAHDGFVPAAGALDQMDGDLASLVVASVVDARRNGVWHDAADPSQEGGPAAIQAIHLLGDPILGGGSRLVGSSPVALLCATSTSLVKGAASLASCRSDASAWPFEEWSAKDLDPDAPRPVPTGDACMGGNPSVASSRLHPTEIRGNNGTICDQAAHIWVKCRNAIGTGDDKISYETDFFNNTSFSVSVTRRGKNGPAEAVELRKLTTNRWTDDRTLTVTLGNKKDGSKSIRIDDHMLGRTALGAGGWCESDTTDAFGTACARGHSYICAVNGCRCLDDGVADTDPWGDAVIDLVAGGLAAPLRALAARGLAHILILNTAENAGRGMFFLGERVAAEQIATKYAYKMNAAISKQYATVRPSVVEKLVWHAQHMSNDTPARTVLELVGEKSITLGEAREVSKRIGRELALQWDPAATLGNVKGLNYLKFGAESEVKVVADGSRKLIWHTHPNAGQALAPSRADQVVLTWTGDRSSFVIPQGSIPYIFKFWL